jgi:uncharacterized protein (TIGR03084 family)
MLAPLDSDGWDKLSACAGWAISDVVLHLAQTDEQAAASARHQLTDSPAGRLWSAIGESSGGTVDDAVAAAVERERGAPGAAVYERWKRGSDDMLQALAGCAPNDRLQWVAGDLAARTLATTRLAECWIHTGDVAEGLGVDHPPSDRLWHIARLAHRTIPYAFTRAGLEPPGPVLFRLISPTDPAEVWTFGEAAPGVTTVTGPAADLCRVAGQRADAADTALRADGPHAAPVLELVRTFA